MRVWFLMVLAIVFMPRDALAEPTGNEWKEGCDKKEPFEIGFCLGEVLGTLDTIVSSFRMSNISIPFCMADGVTNKQIQDIVYKYIVVHPEERHFHLTTLTLEAIKEAFPLKADCSSVPNPLAPH
jgi:hypothetical protein